MYKQYKNFKPVYLKGFTFMEIIVSLVLLALTLSGLMNLFLGGKRWIAHRRYQMTGGQLGKVFLDPLQMDVTMRERNPPWPLTGWGEVNNCLTNPSGPGCPTAQTIDGVTYTPLYAGNIDEVVLTNCQASQSCLRRVRLVIQWTEPAP